MNRGFHRSIPLRCSTHKATIYSLDRKLQSLELPNAQCQHRMLEEPTHTVPTLTMIAMDEANEPRQVTWLSVDADKESATEIGTGLHNAVAVVGFARICVVAC